MALRFRLPAFLTIAVLFAQSSWLATAIAVEPAKVGQQAPDFTATGIDGKQFKLSDRAGKDKNIILMFSRANW